MIKTVGRKRSSVDLDEDDLVFVKQIRAIRRKRIMVSGNRKVVFPVVDDSDSVIKTPVKKNSNNGSGSDSTSLESLPQDVLIRILCCVDHDDLKQLCEVSESIKEAASIAKRDHFAFSTPSKKLPGLRSFCDDLEFDDEPPNAPKQHRNHHRKSRVEGKKLGDITVALFRSPEKQQ
ncbi:hypothetical protein ACHQM5_003433 [Ranunculus cassubicifolius]